jgi:hypothetical protein
MQLRHLFWLVYEYAGVQHLAFMLLVAMSPIYAGFPSS